LNNLNQPEKNQDHPMPIEDCLDDREGFVSSRSHDSSDALDASNSPHSRFPQMTPLQKKIQTLSLGIGCVGVLLGAFLLFPEQTSTLFQPKALTISKNATADNGILDHFRLVQGNLSGPSSENISSGLPFYFSTPDSITQVDETHYFMCNYSQLVFLDLSAKTAQILFPPKGITPWIPTGVFYEKRSKRLYVANYNGQNVFSFEILPNQALKIYQTFTHPQMKSPEGVTVSPNGETLVATDNDANRIFAISTKTGQLLWQAPVGQAHGCTFDPSGQFLYVTGLKPPTLFKFSQQGALLQKTDKKGWGENEYLWPTTVMNGSAKGKGQFIVSDAHTGQISFVSSNLKELETWGGNGPGVNLFNMPYMALLKNANTLLVLDTYNARLLETSLAGEIQKIHSFESTEVPLSSSNLNQNSWIEGYEPLGNSFFKTYVDQDPSHQLQFPLLGSSMPLQWKPGYASFTNDRGLFRFLSQKQLVSFANTQAMFTESFMYFMVGKTFQQDGDDYFVIGSPQSRQLLVGDTDVMVRVDLPRFYWMNEDTQGNFWLVSDQERLPLRPYLDKAVGRIHQFKKSFTLTQHPKNAALFLHEGLFSRFSLAEFSSRLTQSFVTPQGKKFLSTLRPALNPSSPTTLSAAETQTLNHHIQQASAAYLEEVRRKQKIDFTEFEMVQMFWYTAKHLGT
jgi:hypothetical protein